MKKLNDWEIGDPVRQRYGLCRQGVIKSIGLDTDGEVEQIGFEIKTWIGKKLIWDKPQELMLLSEQE